MSKYTHRNNSSVVVFYFPQQVIGGYSPHKSIQEDPGELEYTHSSPAVFIG